LGARLSIVLCTRNRADFLDKTLACYERIATDIAWELVLVDNGSTDRTPQVLRDFALRKTIQVSLFCERRAGASRGRNTGWRHASGEIIAFTDDDCYPQPDFLDKIWKNFSDYPIAYVGGRILLYDQSDYPITIQPSENRLIIKPRSFITPGVIHSANLAFHRKALNVLGGFDEMLGAGTPLRSGEDTDLVSRASAAGYLGAYDPRPVVFHHHRRRTKTEVKSLKRAYDIGRGACYMKSILDPVRRSQYCREWYWRSFIPATRSMRAALKCTNELQGALAYLARRSVYSHVKVSF
jgi:glycosyltransferase involved in cell wall biosynthesis